MYMKKPSNDQIAQILYEIADIQEMQNVQFKPQAYRRAAREIEEIPQKVAEINNTKELEDIPGVGTSIAEKILEISETGTCEYYEQLKRTIPADIIHLMRIEGIGPKTIKRLYDELGVKTIADLKYAAEQHKIRVLEGFGEKTEENILKGIESYKKRSARSRLDEAFTFADDIIQKMKTYPSTEKIEIAGSLRRRKETIGDLDILILTKDSKNSIDYFTKLLDVSRVLGKGNKKATIEFENGFQADLRVIQKKSWGAALQYFTGDKAHNIKVRKIAIEKGWKLNEYGLFDKKGKYIAGKTEEEIYKKLGMDCPPPEIRSDTGEVEASLTGTLPKLIKISDIKGDLQMHTKASDGLYTAEEMAEEASSLKYEYIAITDHNTEGLEVAGGVSIREIPQYAKKLRSIKSNIHILVGLEVNIEKDGSLTVPNKYLQLLDFVLIAIHSHFRMKKEEMTKRILTAFDNPFVHAFAHPTGRLIGRRDAYDFDIDAICKKAKEKKICLELNGQPDRLDLDGDYARLAKKYGCKFTIGTDAHGPRQLHYAQYAVFMARRGWLTKNDIVNTLPFNELKGFLKRKTQ
jgi:DNA polymerase (family 10)